MSRTHFILFCCLLLPPHIWAQEESRVVEGAVVDAKGQPSVTSAISAWPLTAGSSFGTVQWIETKNGQFKLVLKPGRYSLRAKDLTARYPDPSFLLFRDPSAQFPEIDVGDSDLHHVLVKLGHKGSLLKGDVRAHDGTAIPQSKITITDLKDAQGMVILTTNEEGQFELVVPARPLLIKAAAKGFAATVYNSRSPVMAMAGADVVVHLKLIPKSQ